MVLLLDAEKGWFSASLQEKNGKISFEGKGNVYIKTFNFFIYILALCDDLSYDIHKHKLIYIAMWQAVTPVSYTHLDVYKRQVLERITDNHTVLALYR